MTVVVGRGGGSKPRAPRPRPPAGNTPRGQQPVHTRPTKPYLPPSTGSGNNPRGVAISKPKPTRNDHAAKTLNTGNNPRGVAIKERRPKDHSGRLLHGANPRGVAIKMPHLKGVKPPKPKPSGGGGILGIGAITVPPIASSALHVVTHIPSDIEHVVTSPIVKNTAKDIVDLVPGTIEGAETIGKAVVQDAIYDSKHGKFIGPIPLPGPHTTKLAKAAWKQSMTKSLLEGHVGEALKKFKEHPFYSALEFAGGAGAIGRVAGAAARTGALGSKLADAAKLAREDRYLGEGQKGLRRQYSPNLIKKAGQALVDKRYGHAESKVGPAERIIRTHHLGKRVDDIYGIKSAVHRKHVGDLLEEQAKAIKGGHRVRLPKERKGAANVSSYMVQGIADRADFVNELKDLKGKIQSALETDRGRMTRSTEREARKHVKHIDTFLKHPDVKAVEHIADEYAKRGQKLTQQAVEHQIITPEQAARAPLVPYVAAGKMPGVEVAGRAVKSVRSAFHDEAQREVKGAQRAVDHAKLKAAKARTPEAKAAAQRELESAKATLKTAKADARDLEKYANEKLPKETIVTRVRVGRLMNGKPTYGFRRIAPEEVRAHMVSQGVDPDKISHVELIAPGEPEESPFFSAKAIGRGDAKIHARTGSGILKGNFKAGHTALADSQLRTTGRIDRAKASDAFIEGSAYHDDSGRVWAGTQAEVDKRIGRLEADNPGEKFVAVPIYASGKGASAANAIKARVSWTDYVDKSGRPVDPEEFASQHPDARYAIVRRKSVQRYLKHLDVDSRLNSSKWSAITRQFRNTVLPFSPKWLVGNVVEAALRSALVGAGPRDAMLASKVVKAMRASGDHDAADALEAYMGGLHYGMAHSANEKLAGAGALHHPDPGTLRKAVEASRLPEAARAYSNLVQRIYHANRAMEQQFEKAVVGAHMARQLREWGASWAEAATQQQKWIDKLAKGYADPELARAAGRDIHKVLGQYDRFSPAMKTLIGRAAPFAPWYWNALRFVFATMPGDHPLAQSVLLSAARTVQSQYAAQEKALGDLGDKFLGTNSSSLFTDLPTKNNGYLDLSRYAPYGAFANGPVDYASSQFFPQAQGPLLAALANKSPFGQTLQNDNGDVSDQDKTTDIGVAINEIATSILGPVNTAYRIVAEHGSTPFSASTLWNTQLKPNTHHGAPGIVGGVERVLSPIQPTYLRKNKSKGGSSTSNNGLPDIGLGSSNGLPDIGFGK